MIPNEIVAALLADWPWGDFRCVNDWVRRQQTCLRLWEAIPSNYRQGACVTDFWAAYAAVIPKEQHCAVGKETGETAQVERWNTTLRQRLARFVCMTLLFSRSVVMPEACLLLFLHRYTRE